jgi:hypothetical protein
MQAEIGKLQDRLAVLAEEKGRFVALLAELTSLRGYTANAARSLVTLKKAA